MRCGETRRNIKHVWCSNIADLLVRYNIDAIFDYAAPSAVMREALAYRADGDPRPGHMSLVLLVVPQ